jgi:hypothetical protein
MAAVVFFSESLQLQKRMFKVFAPAFYHPYMPFEVMNPPKKPREKPNPYRKVATRPEPTMPMRHLHDPDQMQECFYPIEVMIDMYSKKINFELANEADVVTILDAMDRYLYSARPNISANDAQVIEFVTHILNFRKEIVKHFYRYMMTHPVAAAQYYPNQSKTQNIFHALTRIHVGTEEIQQLDPIRARMKAPYELSDFLVPEAAKDFSDLNSFEISMGIMKDTLSKDDDASLNLIDFISGRAPLC